jgi:signal recognition particle subunit SRP54
MFDSLSDKLQDIIAKASGQKELTQENMQDALREIRRALLEADVNLRVVKTFISNIIPCHNKHCKSTVACSGEGNCRACEYGTCRAQADNFQRQDREH